MAYTDDDSPHADWYDDPRLQGYVSTDCRGSMDPGLGNGSCNLRFPVDSNGNQRVNAGDTLYLQLVGVDPNGSALESAIIEMRVR